MTDEERELRVGAWLKIGPGKFRAIRDIDQSSGGYHAETKAGTVMLVSSGRDLRKGRRRT